MQICVVGIGYVGLSLSVLLSQKYDVVAYDIDQEKINKINNRISPIDDKEIINYFRKKKLKLKGAVVKRIN